MAHTALRQFQVFAKPVGSLCNLGCHYCYYLTKQRLYPDERSFRMSEDVLEVYIAQHIEACPDLVISFSWHGGEPCVLGLDYFRTIVALQRKHQPPDCHITNGIQTNGTLLNEEWCRFLAAEGFAVGISLFASIGMMAHAQTDVAWAAGTSNGDWSNPGNWSTGVVPDSNAVGVDVGSSTALINVDGDFTINRFRKLWASDPAGSTSVISGPGSLTIDVNGTGGNPIGIYNLAGTASGANGTVLEFDGNVTIANSGTGREDTVRRAG